MIRPSRTTTAPIGTSSAANARAAWRNAYNQVRSEEHTSEPQSRLHLVCRLLLEKKKSPRDCLMLAEPHPQHIRLQPQSIELGDETVQLRSTHQLTALQQPFRTRHATLAIIVFVA